MGSGDSLTPWDAGESSGTSATCSADHKPARNAIPHMVSFRELAEDWGGRVQRVMLSGVAAVPLSLLRAVQ